MKIEKIEQNEAVPNEIETLKRYFPHYFDKEGKFLLDKFKNSIAKSTDISKESYSLEWLGKSYARVLAHEPVKTFMKEDSKWNAKEKNKDSQNLLIKGNNLEVLKHLVNAYTGEIKMIYIDPPYNTGDDGFVYQDDRKFTPDELAKLAGISLEKAEKILEFVNSKSNSHSAWLTFMYPRLYVARNLLKKDGVIFVSIDENEYAQLKLLMDETFGEENYIGDFIRKTKSMTGDKSSGFNMQHEYLLCYGKISDNVILQGEYKDYNNYANPDNDPNGEWTPADPTAKSGGESLYFPIKNPYTGKIDYPSKGRFWAFSKETLEEYIQTGRIVFKKTHGEKERGFIFKRYKKELKSDRNSVNSLFATKNIYMNQMGTKELRELFNEEIFNNPKPTCFIKQLLFFSMGKDDVVLDFFAGSGTTGDAIMQLNAEDGGDRKYILIQLPEPIDPKRNKTAYEFVKNELGVENPTIFDITKERLIRAAKKIINDKEKEIEEIRNSISNIENKEKKTKRDEQKLAELRETLSAKRQELERIQSMDLGFKIYETIDIPKEILEETEELSDTLPLPKEIDTNTLLTTWKLFDGAKLTEEAKEIDLEGYTAYLVGNRLYLLTSGFTTNNLTAMLRKIDEDNSFAPSKIVANGYALNSKAQRELYEGILNFVNKKHIELEFIVRY